MNVSSQLHKMLLYTGYVKQNVFITLLISFEKKNNELYFCGKNFNSFYKHCLQYA